MIFKNYKRTFSALILISLASSQMKALELKSVFLFFTKNINTSKTATNNTIKYFNKKNILPVTSILAVAATIAGVYLFSTKKWPFNFIPKKNNPDDQNLPNDGINKTSNTEEKFISLKINAKPKNISMYKWCNQRAKDLVLEKELAILKFLEKSEAEFKIEKNDSKISHKVRYKKNKDISYKKQPLSASMQKLLLEVLENDKLQKKLNIEKIFVENNIIIVERTNKEPIKFLNNNEHEFSTNGYDVEISEEKIKQKNLSNDAVKAFIVHELAHIKFKHNLKRHAFINMYNKIKNNNSLLNKEIKDFNTLLSDFNKATEAQADIFCFLKNKTWLENLINTFNNMAQSPQAKSSLNHPKCSTRANYLNQIYCSLEN
ncbi:MAG: hypothetical protein UR12_C0028G0010 [candidate division TM6 bacterium GW2011_GWF2_30_66]|jgi:hypothetical protein|nr:MAG: hypothetical protein UR12_C0028G0010 [candidate division TM6 bacterium GW2011_GWF2_30_66]